MFTRKGRKYLTLSPSTQRAIWLILKVLNAEAGKAVVRAEAQARRWGNEPAAKHQRDHWRRHQASIRQIASRLTAKWSREEITAFAAECNLTIDIEENNELSRGGKALGGGDPPSGSGSSESSDSESDREEGCGSGGGGAKLLGAGRDRKACTASRKPGRPTKPKPDDSSPADR